MMKDGPWIWKPQCLRFRIDTELGKRTPSHDRVVDGEIPAKEIGVGRSATREVALSVRLGDDIAAHLGRCAVTVVARESTTSDDSDEGSQDLEKGEEPHSVWLSGKCGREREREAKRNSWGKAAEIGTVFYHLRP